MNTFHWHITDSQSFPLEVNGFSELSQKGAYSSDEIYSASDVDGIVSYAGAVCGNFRIILFYFD
jgi:hexosaminidase